MKEKILALLTAQFSGVRKDGLSQLASIIALQVNAFVRRSVFRYVAVKKIAFHIIICKRGRRYAEWGWCCLFAAIDNRTCLTYPARKCSR
jgi:hypothetical protein